MRGSRRLLETENTNKGLTIPSLIFFYLFFSGGSGWTK